MKITKENILIYDVETILSFFLISIYEPSTNTWIDFCINQYRNDIYRMIKWMDCHRDRYWVGFNNLSFDGQVMEYIWRNYEQWFDKNTLEIAFLIWEFSQKVIDDSNYGLFPPYHENSFSFKQVDIFKIQHFDNKNRVGNNPGMVGLKRIEYEMDAVNIEEMGVKHDKMSFTEEEAAKLVYYCHNDVWETYRNYLHITGDTDHPIYKGTNQIEIREALSEEFGFDCINYSNSKYGDEIIKTLYCKETDISYDSLPKRGTFRKEILFGEGIPDYVEFKTPELKAFLESIRNKRLEGNGKFEEVVTFGLVLDETGIKQQYTFALGGLHNVIENKSYESDNEYVIVDADVTGYYVATIINNEYCPAHIRKKAFIKAYKWIRDERERLKPLGKKDKKIKGIVAGYKEAGVSVYGKLGDMTNWLYDPQARLNVCIAGELSILMLIEAQELAGNRCIMANTDGATFIIKRNERDKFDDVCKKWTKTTNYKLEFFNFKRMYFLNVNHYIAQYEDYVDPVMGDIKCKGELAIYSELHKNKSFRVIPLAVKAYFMDGIAPEDFINSYSNVFNFCARSTGGQTYSHFAYDEDNNPTELPKLVRYYVAKEGVTIKKVVKKGNVTGAKSNLITPAELPKYVCNSLPEESYKFHLDNIDRQWYIDQAKIVIFKLEHKKKPRIVRSDPNQISLF